MVFVFPCHGFSPFVLLRIIHLHNLSHTLILNEAENLTDAVAEAIDSAGDAEAILYSDNTDHTPLETRSAPNDTDYVAGNQYNLDAIQAPQAWDVVTANNVIVAIIDTGVDTTHNDLGGNFYCNGNLWCNPAEISGDNVIGEGDDDDLNNFIDDYEGWDFVDNDNEPYDSDGHGTHVAGIVAAVTNDGYGVAGVSGANGQPIIMSLRALGGQPTLTTLGNVVNAINYAVANGANIINMSLGFNVPTDVTIAQIAPLQAAIDNANNDGVTIVAASGNCPSYGPDCTDPLYPAQFENVISVSATDSGNSFAYNGLKTDIAAPGKDILSTWFNSPSGVDRWNQISGSSMAAPHVAGVAALLYSNGVTSPADIYSYLINTALDLGDPGQDGLYGFGLVQAYDALMYTPPAPPAPPASPDEPSELTTVYADAVISVHQDANGKLFIYLGPGTDTLIASLLKSTWSNAAAGEILFSTILNGMNIFITALGSGQFSVQCYSTVDGSLLVNAIFTP